MTPSGNPVDGWDTWAKKVLGEQQRIAGEIESCRRGIAAQSTEIAELRASMAAGSARIKDICQEAISNTESMTEFRIQVSRELATLQAKSGVWGAVGALAVLLVAWLMSQLGG